MDFPFRLCYPYSCQNDRTRPSSAQEDTDMMAFIGSVFNMIGSFINIVFGAVASVFHFVFSVLGGLLGLVLHLGMLLLVVGLVALVITRRKNYKQAKADEPRVIHMDNGETFKSYYSK